MLLAGEGIAVSEADGAYTISTLGNANSALSNLYDVAINTDLIPGVNGSINIGAPLAAFNNGYFTGTVNAGSFDSLSGGTLSIGGASSVVALNADTTIGSGKTLTSGKILVKNSANPASAFEVQRASGVAILSVSASTSRVGIGAGSSPANKLSVGTLTTADSSAQVAITTGSSVSKGLVVQAANTNPYYSLIEAQASDGSVLTSIGASGISTSGDLEAADTLGVTGGAYFSSNAVFRNGTNSANALVVQAASGQGILKVNTTDERIDMGTFVPTTKWVKPPVTPASYDPAGSSLNMNTAQAADINGDGFEDFVVRSAAPNLLAYINRGDGTFGSPVYTALPVSERGLEDMADVNGDGYADVLLEYFISVSDNGAMVMMGNGSGGFGSPAYYKMVTSYGIQYTYFADMNGDSRDDIVSVSEKIETRLNNGNGVFGSALSSISASVNATMGLSFADFDGNGHMDLVYANRTGHTVVMVRGNGNGTFSSWQSYPSPVNGPSETVAGDFNGDGAMDIGFTSGGVSIEFFIGLNSGNGTMGNFVEYEVGGLVYALRVGKLSNSGRSDVIVADKTNKMIKVYIANSDGTLSQPAAYSTSFASGSGPSNATVADFNNNGIDDIVMTDGQDYINVMLMTVFGSYNTTPPDSKLLVNINSDEAGQVIKGTFGQTADYLRVIDNYEDPVMVLNSAGDLSLSGGLSVNGAYSLQGAANIQTSINSVNGLRVQDAAGSTIFNVDTQNGRVGIKTSAAVNALAVNTLTTADSAAQVAVSTSSAGAKGLVVQGVSGQTADLIQAQSSVGTVLARITSSGALTVVTATVSGNITMNSGHIIITGLTPTYAAGAAACTLPVISITGSDTSGTITLTTGSACASPGTLLTMTFRAIYSSAPRVMLTAGNAAAAGLGLYSGTSGTTTCTIDAVSIPVASTVYKINYWAVQ